MNNDCEAHFWYSDMIIVIFDSRNPINLSMKLLLLSKLLSTPIVCCLKPNMPSYIQTAKKQFSSEIADILLANCKYGLLCIAATGLACSSTCLLSVKPVIHNSRI